jgi:hypothetical protein
VWTDELAQQFAEDAAPPALQCREDFRLIRALDSLPAPVAGGGW